MSTRQMAHHYAQVGRYGGGYGGGTNGGSGILGLIQSLFGNQKVEGGIQTDPVTGKLIYSPYTAHQGFLNGPGQSEAARLNESVGVPAYLYQLQHAGDLENTKESGNQDRLTDTNKYQVEGKEHRLTADQANQAAIQAEKLKSYIKYLSEAGIPYSDKNLMDTDNMLTGPRQKNQLDAANLTAQQNELQKNVMGREDYKDSFNEGAVQKNLEPAWMNQLRSRVNAPADSIELFNPRGGEGQTQVTGPMKDSTTFESKGGVPFTNKDGTQSVIGGESKIKTFYTPGSVRQMVPPNLIRDAQARYGSGSTNNPTVPPPMVADPTMGLNPMPNASQQGNGIQGMSPEMLQMLINTMTGSSQFPR